MLLLGPKAPVVMPNSMNPCFSCLTENHALSFTDRFNVTFVLCISRLLCAAGAEAGMTAGLTVPKRKMGCSCGKCIKGWLSPRMSHRSACHRPLPGGGRPPGPPPPPAPPPGRRGRAPPPARGRGGGIEGSAYSSFHLPPCHLPPTVEQLIPLIHPSLQAHYPLQSKRSVSILILPTPTQHTHTPR